MGNGADDKGQGQQSETTVFLSYSREDQKRALPIIDVLQKAGFAVWWDGLLEGGERFSKTTEAALERAKAVVVLWSKTSVASHWVHDEATRGRDRGCLVPLSIDGSEPPLGFRQYQVIDVTHAKMAASAPEMQSLVRAVAALHDRPIDLPIPQTSAAPTVSRRKALIGGGALLAGGGLAAWMTGLVGGKGRGTNSIGVLPFANLSGDPKQAYFSDGLAAEVRAHLSRNPLLQVAAQTSSNSFRERTEDVKTIARKLGVAFLLEGSVRRSGDMVRIDTQLIDGRTGFEKWSESFDRSIENIFAVQSEIAAMISTQLSSEIDSGGSKKKPDKRITGGTESVAAFDAYLRGKDLYEAGTDKTTDRLALAKFDEAITADPNYAAAHAARSRSLAVIANQYSTGSDLRALYRESLLAARRAVELAPEFAEAHSALGFALAFGQMDIRAARKPYDMSLKLGSGDADILSRYATYSSRYGNFAEADKAISRSQALDPLNARTFRSAGAIHYGAGRYQQALEALNKGLELNPTLGTARANIGAAYFMMGNIEAAKAAYDAEKNSLFALPGLAIIAWKQGDRAGAQKALEQLIAEHGSNGLYQQAQVYAQWGENKKAVDALLAARAAGDSGLILMYNDPLLRPIRNEPEFSRLLSEIGFV